MFQVIRNLTHVKELRNKILFTLLMLVVVRLGTHIPAPLINTNVLKIIDQNSALGFLNMFGGGAIQNFSLLAMGIMPYITASIVIQLLQMDVVKKLSDWAKEGEVGKKKLSQLTRYLAIILGLIEGVGMAYGFNRQYGGALISNANVWKYILISLALTAGTAMLIWIGDLITQQGVGNGISVIIFAGIVAQLPQTTSQLYATFITGAGDKLYINIGILIGIVLLMLLVTVLVIYVQQAVRKVPVQYAKRANVRGSSVNMGAQATHLPLKVNSAGVIPVIFAVSFIMTPKLIASFFDGKVANWITVNFDYSKPLGMSMYLTLIIAFSFFYAFITVNPEKIAENLQKQSGYVPGIRPGQKTQQYFTSILIRLTTVGALFLALVAVLPMALASIANLPSSIQIGGTSLLIMVGVALETMKQLEGQLVKRNYRGFINSK